MKKILTGFLFAFISVVLLLGCKKETTEFSAISSDRIIKKIETWYAGLPTELKSPMIQIQGKSTQITEVPVWSELKFDAANLLTIVPIKVGEIKSVTPALKYLVVRTNGQGEIVETNYFKIFNGNYNSVNTSVSNINTVITYDIFQNKKSTSDFTGRIFKYDINNKLLTTHHYENGSLIYAKDEQQNNSGGIDPVAPIVCSSWIVDSWWVTYCDGVIVEIEYLYSTTYTNCPEGGGSGGTNNPFYIAYSLDDDFLYTCPSNFTFTSITTNNLWQEAGISNSYCNLVYRDNLTNAIEIRQITIPYMYFGLPYYNQNGGIFFTSNQAKTRAANAFNDGEYAMRNYFKTHPYATDYELKQKWIEGADASLEAQTYGAGKVSTQPSMNPVAPIVIQPYASCY